MKKYKLTDEHRAQLTPWADKWIAAAMSTAAMTDHDRDICRDAVVRLYAAANLKPPRIVFTPSPFVARFAGGFAAAIWYGRQETRAATYDATSAATSAATAAATAAATRDATVSATSAATFAATFDATRDATAAATRAATFDAIDAATRAATRDATFAATRDATFAATADATAAATADATAAATFDATRDATADATRDATRAATSAATADATFAATADATAAATYAATRDATFAATDAATDDATVAATRDATAAATRDATYAATVAATRAATYAATVAATRAATYDATSAATRDATFAATYAATRDATFAATADATFAATSAATRAATVDAIGNSWYIMKGGDIADLAVKIGVGKFGLICAQYAWRMWQGGNQWSGYDAFISFFRHIVSLPIDYRKWDAWETLSLHSGPRVMHEKFCIISDRPERLMVDAENRPHCDDGPFCRWRDGSALYSIHGVRVPQYVVERPNLITIENIDAETNAEVKRVMIDRYKRGEEISGAARYIKDAGGTKLDHDEAFGTLYRREIGNDDEAIVMLEVINRSPEPDGSYKHYWLRVPPTMRKSSHAWNWLNGLKPKFRPNVIQT